MAWLGSDTRKSSTSASRSLHHADRNMRTPLLGDDSFDAFTSTLTNARNVEGNMNTALRGEDIDSYTPLTNHETVFIRIPSRLAQYVLLRTIDVLIFLSYPPRAVLAFLRSPSGVFDALTNLIVRFTGWLGDEMIPQRVFKACSRYVWYIWCCLLLAVMFVSGGLLVVFRDQRESFFMLVGIAAVAALSLTMSVAFRCMCTSTNK